MSGAVYLWKMFRAQAEQHSGVSQKVFGFIPESVFAFIPECCSESARNPVRLHPGMLFALPRNTHSGNVYRQIGAHASVAGLQSWERRWQLHVYLIQSGLPRG
jgi:hypothetical protein